MARIFITGSSDGLGLLAAKSLLKEGHKVVLHARNENRALKALDSAPRAEKVLVGDLSSIKQTKQLASDANKLGRFDAVIHNAGILNVPEKATSTDGLPLLFAVNSLAPYILTALLTKPERVIYLSSSMHRQVNASIELLSSIQNGKYFPRYSDTKLHDLMLALTVARKWPDTISNAVDPGWVPTKMGGKNAVDNLEEGYKTQAWLSVSNDLDALQSGRLLYHQSSVRMHPLAANEAIQEKFLSVCENISGISFS